MSLTVGTHLGRYEIRSKIGEGGMGEVYLAYDTALDRKVALKVLPPDIAVEPQRLRRFHQEARAASALNHPHIAHIYEIAEHEGQPFIAMEYVEGLPLNTKIGGRPLAVSEIVRLAIQIADALNEAHENGITHRDIKPSNIMITPRGQAKLLDFGLAKVRGSVDQELSQDATTQLKTAEGLVLGTVMYMSPEQALGQEVDRRSDIFSFGTLLYEMATGKLPFAGSTTTEIIDRIVHAQPESMTRLNYDLSPELERIIRKSLEKEKERRYQSASDLLVDLENLKRDSTVEGVSTEKTARRQQNYARPWTLGVIAFLIVALAGTSVYFWKHFNRPAETAIDSIDSIAVLPFTNANGDPNTDYLSDGITESIINSLSQLPHLKVTPRVSVFRYKGRQIDPKTVGREMGVRAVLTGKVVQVGDTLSIQAELVDVNSQSQLWGQKYNRKLSDILTLEDEIASQISDNLRLKLSGVEHQQLVKRYTQNTEAHQLYLKGRYYWKKYTRDGLDRSIDYFNQAIAKDPNYALAYSALADAYVVLGGGYLPPNEVLPKARAAAEKALKIDESLAAGHISMGAYKLFYEWDWPAAQKEAQRAKELNAGYARAIELNTNYDDSHHFYCQALDTLGKPEESIAEMRRALELDPLSTTINMEMGWSYYIARDYDQALAQCRKTIEMDPAFIDSYICTAMTYAQKRMYQEAIADLKKASAIASDDPAVITQFGITYALSGQKAAAQKAIATLKDMAAQRYIDPTLLAFIYIALGENNSVFEWLEKAYRARSPWFTWLKVEPKFDPVRQDPRFAEMVRRVGLPS